MRAHCSEETLDDRIRGNGRGFEEEDQLTVLARDGVRASEVSANEERELAMQCCRGGLPRCCRTSNENVRAHRTDGDTR